MVTPSRQKVSGAYFTPECVVESLVRWAARRASERMLDPSCGDGRFLAAHPNSVGVEQDPESAAIVHARVPGSLIHEGDFFAWASKTHERFECAAGNPPFIRYQRFNGSVRECARALCERQGVRISALASSWAPFLIGTASLLKPGGRMAFVVPAEIGHAPYAAPVLEYLVENFGLVQVVPVRHKIFPDLSEDCWLLFADGFGGSTDAIRFTPMDQFGYMPAPPSLGIDVPVSEWKSWNCRLRPFFLSDEVRDFYTETVSSADTVRLGEVARVGIGYVTGANDFFHLRPSEAERLRIPSKQLHPAVRNGRSLSSGCVTAETVDRPPTIPCCYFGFGLSSPCQSPSVDTSTALRVRLPVILSSVEAEIPGGAFQM